MNDIYQAAKEGPDALRQHLLRTGHDINMKDPYVSKLFINAREQFVYRCKCCGFLYDVVQLLD